MVITRRFRFYLAYRSLYSQWPLLYVSVTRHFLALSKPCTRRFYYSAFISSGRVFQTRGSATVKARSPTVERLVPERKVRRPGRSAVRTSGPKYRGALPCRTSCVNRATLDSIRSSGPHKCNTAAIQEKKFLYYSCIVVVLHLCGPLQ